MGPGRRTGPAAALTSKQPQVPSGGRDLPERQLHDLMQQQPGYTGTALALLAAGVPQVVAMRYEVGDDYARELARAFYRHLLADPAGHSPETALALARGELFRQPDQSAFSPVDHCTPLFFGNTARPLVAAHGASRQMERRAPQPWPLLSAGSRELDPAPPQGFVGRGAELSRLAERWLPRPSDASPAAGAAVAVVQGLAGLGKTALAGEGIHLWHGQFKYVLCFQAKPTPLQVDEFLRQVDFRLTNVSPAYRERCERNERDRVYLPVGTLPAEQRDGLLFENLIQALRNEAVLLVLDNWETNLEPQPTAEHGYRARDPRWDRLLERLSAELPATRSRLLVTTRHRPAALADASRVEWLLLGPLPPAEAGLYVRAHDGLRALYFSGGDEGRELVERLLRISRGHPLILDRLARLAPDRQALAAALDQLETGGLSRLPDLFAAAGHTTDADRERERQYLEDVAVGSIDLLLQRLSPDACRLLWVISLANEPAAVTTIESVWAGRA